MQDATELVESIWSRLKVIDSPEPHAKKCGSSCGTGTCGNGLEKIYPTTAVRFGYMNHIGEFTHEPGMLFGCGGKVVIRSERGIELGEQVSLTCHGCDKSVNRDQMKAYIDNSGPDFLRLKAGQILREATPSDLTDAAHLKRDEPERIRFCQEAADRLGLEMKIVASEHLLGGERIIFYFMSEGRVDFRTLVRELASAYHTRIEMRQVGARDEARLVADYETCGRECCCKNFLKTLRPVSMKMAKVQKATLDPSKVSGRCGRLKCCLRYEHETYDDLDRKLPRINKFIRTAHGDGVVVDRQILTQLVQIRTASDQRITVVVEDVHEVLDRVPEDFSSQRPQTDRPERGPRRGSRPRPGSEERTQDLPRADRPSDSSGAEGPSDRARESNERRDEGESGGGADNDRGPRSRRSRRRRRGGRGGGRAGPPTRDA